jgi:hypothetical protein
MRARHGSRFTRSSASPSYFAGLGALGTAIIAGTLARSITRPLRALLTATRKLIRDPQTKEGFPLEVTSPTKPRTLPVPST